MLLYILKKTYSYILLLFSGRIRLFILWRNPFYKWINAWIFFNIIYNMVLPMKSCLKYDKKKRENRRGTERRRTIKWNRIKRNRIKEKESKWERIKESRKARKKIDLHFPNSIVRHSFFFANSPFPKKKQIIINWYFIIPHSLPKSFVFSLLCT